MVLVLRPCLLRPRMSLRPRMFLRPCLLRPHMLHPHTLCPRMLHPRTLRPRMLHLHMIRPNPGCDQSQPTELHQPVGWLGMGM
jgi:hypothetical protein